MRFHSLVRFVLFGCMTALLVPSPISAQTARRWLSDPAFTENFNIVAMDLIDARNGFAVGNNVIARYDGRYWRPHTRFDTDIRLFEIDMATPTSGWAAGATVYQTSAGIRFARWDGANWTLVTDIVRKDGTPSQVAGYVSDITAFPDGTALALAFSYPRTLVLRYDGNVWRDETPDAWGEGGITEFSMISPSEGWFAGTFALPNNQRRPVILHYKDGRWTEEAIPTIDVNGVSTVVMRNATEGWAVFYKVAEGCDTSRVLHYLNGVWTAIPSANHNDKAIIAFELIPGTNRGWASLQECTPRVNALAGQRTRFDNGAFTADQQGTQLLPTAYALLTEDVQAAAAGSAFLRFSDEALPTVRTPELRPYGNIYFPESGHNLSGRFLRYYETNGLNLGDPGTSARESLALFGYPLSEPFTEINPDTGELLEVQYFERARMEFHPQNRDPYRVLLGRLTVPMLRRSLTANVPAPTPVAPGCSYYIETGFDLCPPFRQFWNSNGALPVFGYPISRARDELSRTDGKTYLTQYFERERLEYHPENSGTPYEVLLGLLGAEDLRLRGYIP